MQRYPCLSTGWEICQFTRISMTKLNSSFHEENFVSSCAIEEIEESFSMISIPFSDAGNRDKWHRVSERLAYLGMMGGQLRAPREPLTKLLLDVSRDFRRHSIRTQWYREMPVCQTAVRVIAVVLSNLDDGSNFRCHIDKGFFIVLYFFFIVHNGFFISLQYGTCK